MIIRSRRPSVASLSCDAPRFVSRAVFLDNVGLTRRFTVSERQVFDRECFGLLRGCAAAIALAVALGLLPSTVNAQVLYGSLTGNVTDSSGAAIPGATVSIKDEQTGLALSAVSDASGV